jgi:hypothetical protein
MIIDNQSWTSAPSQPNNLPNRDSTTSSSEILQKVHTQALAGPHLTQRFSKSLGLHRSALEAFVLRRKYHSTAFRAVPVPVTAGLEVALPLRAAALI